MAIQIIGNVGNQGYALPMVSASPIDVNSQYVLGWNPVAQALDYVPFIVAAIGDIGVVRDLTVGRDALVTRHVTVGGNLSVTGTTGLTGALTVTGAAILNGGIAPTDGGLEVTGAVTTTGAITSAATVGVTSGPNSSVLNSIGLNFQATKVVGIRQPGWVALTGTPLRSTFTTAGITLPQLAGIVMALQADMISHGLIGA